MGWRRALFADTRSPRLERQKTRQALSAAKNESKLCKQDVWCIKEQGAACSESSQPAPKAAVLKLASSRELTPAPTARYCSTPSPRSVL